MKLFYKLLLFILSVIIAWVVIQNGYLQRFVEIMLPIKFLAEIIAGAFYVFFLTSPISIAMLLELSKVTDPFIVAILGGIGAAVGDLLIVLLFRKEFGKDLRTSARFLKVEKFRKTFKKLHLEFVPLILGGIIIASPLADEIGLLLWGVSDLKYSRLFIISYLLNTLGIMVFVLSLNLLR